MAELKGLSLVSGALQTDIDEICALTEMGWADRPLWAGMMQNVSASDIRNLLASIHIKRVEKPENEYFRVVDKATGRTVAWASLLHPRPTDLLPSEGGAVPIEMPNIPGINKRLAGLFFNQFGITAEYGYDATQHFHRKGTFVHREFQRRGLATLLQEQCNQIADTAGKATFVLAIPTSKKLFENGGFKVVATFEYDVSGDGKVTEQRWVMRRDPQPMRAQ
ncbi:hypothetical protein BDV96DRAFT_690726 [Lophiotrema nucula]|uniref:N-acetyltransferase domain-containing protein n=1 Tax=Lophiotrema nucula TaxID=690887 RepID=A0A6A5YUI3_9PLEO|nr:hypothetical protein BDV96DRAFT_690726 [Lophiotrema nucula]